MPRRLGKINTHTRMLVHVYASGQSTITTGSNEDALHDIRWRPNEVSRTLYALENNRWEPVMGWGR